MDDHDDAFTPLPSRKRTGWRPLDFVRRRHARFREEWCLMEASGMFGDFGTLLPLLLAMANVGSVAPAAALFWFGAFNVATAYEWDVPMCVQPMKTSAQRNPSCSIFRATQGTAARSPLTRTLTSTVATTPS